MNEKNLDLEAMASNLITKRILARKCSTCYKLQRPPTVLVEELSRSTQIW